MPLSSLSDTDEKLEQIIPTKKQRPKKKRPEKSAPLVDSESSDEERDSSRSRRSDKSIDKEKKRGRPKKVVPSIPVASKTQPPNGFVAEPVVVRLSSKIFIYFF